MNRRNLSASYLTQAFFGVILGGILSAGEPAVAATWDPAAFAKEDTLELRTNCPGEGEYRFPVWLVVVDNAVYVRLGSKAAGRIECNTSKPFLPVTIAGASFERIEAVAAPEAAAAVAAAMGSKYTSDFFIRWFPHPLTLRLAPAP